MGDQYARAPFAADPSSIVTMMYKAYNLKDMFVLDSWPIFQRRLLVICDPVSLFLPSYFIQSINGFVGPN